MNEPTTELAVIKTIAEEAQILIDAELKEYKVSRAKDILRRIKCEELAIEQYKKNHEKAVADLREELAEVEGIESVPQSATSAYMNSWNALGYTYTVRLP